MFLKNKLFDIEVADRSTQPDCPTFTPETPSTTLPYVTLPGSPNSTITTTTSTTTTTTTPKVIYDLAASKILSSYACLGNRTTIKIPNDFQLYPLNVYYGVSINGTCKINSKDCRSPAELTCSQRDTSCTISLYNDVPVPDCGDEAIASYIAIEYRFVPCK